MAEMNLRELCEQRERESLSPYACLAADTKGRARDEEKCPMRTDFQRDRDRIIHCKALRRLMHKTQVFISPEGDHYRTRLTHTLEVAQIARTIARALRLNEDLTEAIALGHDLGHTPFGHCGERTLNELYPEGFAHNVHSLRVVDTLENNPKGLNLCFEVRDGIVNHVSGAKACTLEGDIVRFADRIAYINHDIDDAIRGGVLTLGQIPTGLLDRLGRTHSGRINTMIMAIVSKSADRPEILMDEGVYRDMLDLRTVMFEKVYRSERAVREEEKAKHILTFLYEYYVEHPDRMPDEYLASLFRDGPERTVCDYISGMTDRYAIARFTQLTVPRSWQLV